jgi:hypothetical protein
MEYIFIKQAVAHICPNSYLIPAFVQFASLYFMDILFSHKCQLENVHAHDIVDGNPKIVLGLFWKLILKYQLTTLKPIEGKELNKVSIVVIKKSLLLWCQSAIQK